MLNETGIDARKPTFEEIPGYELISSQHEDQIAESLKEEEK